MSFNRMPEIQQDEVQSALTFSSEQVLRNLPSFTHNFQSAYSENNFYQPTENVGWTTGFWTGEIWLAYEFCHDQRLLEAANVQIDSFYQRITNKVDVGHHDMGFLYSPSCVAGYQLTGSQQGHEAALLAAQQLADRYQPKGKFIQAWGGLESRNDYRLIIDCLLNVPLLYWAAKETGVERYHDIAENHVHTALANVVRPDGSTWHTFYLDPDTGLPSHGATCQGYRDGSAWARGQAWGVYGTALAYRYTKEEAYKGKFQTICDYFVNHLPSDMIPYWDLCFTDGEDQPRDSSAANIAACGMLEMAKFADKDEAEKLLSLARKIMKSLYDHYAVKDSSTSNGLVLHSTYSNHTPYNTCGHYGVDECNIWGDYFYMEAMTRLSRDWRAYW